MPVKLGPIGQIALPVSDVDRAEAFYGDILGLRKLYRYGDLTFFDCAGVRLLLEKVAKGATVTPQGDIALAVHELSGRGVAFDGKPHLIAKMDDHDLWMAFFKDPEGHALALMQEAPKGYSPAS